MTLATDHFCFLLALAHGRKAGLKVGRLFWISDALVPLAATILHHIRLVCGQLFRIVDR